MRELVFTEEDYASLLYRLSNSKFESCAILTTNIIRTDRSLRLLVRKIQIAPPDAYRKRNTSAAILDPSFFVPIAKAALKSSHGLVFVHTHPRESGVPYFSSIDSEGEALLDDFLNKRGVSGPNAALLFGQEQCKARLLGTDTEIDVVVVGLTRRVVFNSAPPPVHHQTHDRQVRMLGREAQQQLRRMSVGVVGLGGTGSVVVQQLAHLGVENFVLIDHDFVEETNLNRLVGAQHEDVGAPKVCVAEKQIKSIAPHANVVTVPKSILDSDGAHALLQADFIFCCTDNQASRAVVNQLIYQYVIPGIDMGVSITTQGGVVQRIVGRVQLLSPGQACLTCQELLDPNVVRQEFMTEEQKAQDPYFIGEGEPQPAVISLNSTMSSLAVTMFLAVAAGLPSKARQLNYDALLGRIRASSATPYATCIVCSSHGALAKGHEWQLPVRIIGDGDTQK